MEEHLPKAIPSSIKDILRDAFTKGKIAEIHLNFYQTLSKDVEIFDQGNGLSALPFVNLPDTSVKAQDAMVITNSCDTSSDHDHTLPSRATYCSIKKLNSLETMLISKAKLEKRKVNKFITSVKSQQVTDMFYLPKGKGVSEDSVVMFSFASSIDTLSIKERDQPNIKFVLSQAALYLLITKLSIHFLRFGEVQTI